MNIVKEKSQSLGRLFDRLVICFRWNWSWAGFWRAWWKEVKTLIGGMLLVVTAILSVGMSAIVVLTFPLYRLIRGFE